MVHHTKQGKDIIVGDFIWNSLTGRFFLVLQIQIIPNNSGEIPKDNFWYLGLEGKIQKNNNIAFSMRYTILGTPK